MTVIRSKKIRNAARGEECTLRFAHIVFCDPETVVLCHIHDQHHGMGTKASDMSAIFGCHLCHQYLDIGHGTNPLMSDAVYLRHILRALQETHESLVERGIIIVALDQPRQHKTATRKPKGQRQAFSGSKTSKWKKKINGEVVRR